MAKVEIGQKRVWTFPQEPGHPANGLRFVVTRPDGGRYEDPRAKAGVFQAPADPEFIERNSEVLETAKDLTPRALPPELLAIYTDMALGERPLDGYMGRAIIQHALYLQERVRDQARHIEDLAWDIAEIKEDLRIARASIAAGFSDG